MFNVSIFAQKDKKVSRIGKYTHPSDEPQEVFGHVSTLVKKMGPDAGKIVRIQIDRAGLVDKLEIPKDSK